MTFPSDTANTKRSRRMTTSHIPRTKREAVAKIRAASLEQLHDWLAALGGDQCADAKLRRRPSPWIARCAGELKRELDRRYQAGRNAGAP